ncbi:MAG: hypothetical protein IKC63_02285 [Clostridia bacterium]|nr:hypothetical protein [Clostridia bacterium]
MKAINFLTKSGRVVRLRFDDGISVEAYGQYFTLDHKDPVSVSVSDTHLILVLEGEGDNLVAYTLDGRAAFTLSTLGVSDTLIGGTVMTPQDAMLFCSRYPELSLVRDHTYYLATTVDYRMIWIDLDVGEVIFRT